MRATATRIAQFPQTRRACETTGSADEGNDPMAETRLARRALCSAPVVLLIAGCSASPAPVVSAPAAAESSVSDIVVAVRPVTIKSNQGDFAGFSLVCAALQTSAPAEGVSLQEIVARRPDGTAGTFTSTGAYQIGAPVALASISRAGPDQN